ncbi:hypothetical protein ATCV1_z406R [Acanthocystis turfacea chlorella virus 1]|uniref:Uncharacterized protein z406R n=1 Tax=Chlorovirus heliozoae TaxID=322019 RepID=A7K916_9PHYC|nr:hypothetical protein ATCV1_z406R [Acanthocystis turfacea chlorella virus 1]ABT16540.1 hypothetical protein ATCV1_z406R [Acanthocystis turfacea chlorella virus 1]
MHFLPFHFLPEDSSHTHAFPLETRPPVQVNALPFSSVPRYVLYHSPVRWHFPLFLPDVISWVALGHMPPTFFTMGLPVLFSVFFPPLSYS